MDMIDCPKCGFHQKQGDECLRCGIVFARYHSAFDKFPAPMRPDLKDVTLQPKTHIFRSIYRIFRWASLAVSILVLVLILVPTAAPPVSYTPEQVQQAEAKVQDFKESTQIGRPDSLAMDESELNGWLGNNLALKGSERIAPAPTPKTPESAILLAKKAVAPESAAAAELQQAQSSVRDVKIALHEDSMTVHVAFELYGKSLSLELAGRLGVQDGYLRFEPISGKLGSLPLLAGSLKGTVDRLFSSPENREKFRLPPQIQDIRIEQRQLIVSTH